MALNVEIIETLTNILLTSKSSLTLESSTRNIIFTIVKVFSKNVHKTTTRITHTTISFGKLITGILVAIEKKPVVLVSVDITITDLFSNIPDETIRDSCRKCHPLL